ncbi:hypothetical protein B0T26DRAFT_758090, partial [Lasiosphaeria miniovina]
LPVDYKPLPTDRNFLFNSKHSAVVNALIDAKTPKLVRVVNPSRGTMTIPKHFHVGEINENTNSGYFATTWGKAMKVLTAAIVAASLFSPAAASAAAVTSVQPLVNSAFHALNSGFPIMDSVPTVGVNMTDICFHAPPVSSKFEMTDLIRGLATGNISLDTPPYLPNSANITPSGITGIPISDFVYNIIEPTTAPIPVEQPSVPVEPDPDKAESLPPSIEKHSTLGLKMSDDLPEMIIEERVRIHDADKAWEKELKKVVKEFPKL